MKSCMSPRPLYLLECVLSTCARLNNNDVEPKTRGEKRYNVRILSCLSCMQRAPIIAMADVCDVDVFAIKNKWKRIYASAGFRFTHTNTHTKYKHQAPRPPVDDYDNINMPHCPNKSTRNVPMTATSTRTNDENCVRAALNFFEIISHYLGDIAWRRPMHGITHFIWMRRRSLVERTKESRKNISRTTYVQSFDSTPPMVFRHKHKYGLERRTW